MKARGRTRMLLKALGTIQDLSGQAMGVYMNDRSSNRFDQLMPLLQQIFDLCVQILSMYDPIP